MTCTTEIQRTIKDCYEHLHTNKLDNGEEIDKFLETCCFPKLIHEEIVNPNRLITLVIKNLPTSKSQYQTDSLVNSTKQSKI